MTSAFCASDGFLILHAKKTFDAVVSPNGVAGSAKGTELELGPEIGIPSTIRLLPFFHDVGVRGVRIAFAIIFLELTELIGAPDGRLKCLLHIADLTTQAGADIFAEGLALHESFHLLFGGQRRVLDGVTILRLGKGEGRAGVELTVGHIELAVVIGDFLDGVKVVFISRRYRATELLQLVTFFRSEDGCVKPTEKCGGLCLQLAFACGKLEPVSRCRSYFVIGFSIGGHEAIASAQLTHLLLALLLELLPPLKREVVRVFDGRIDKVFLPKGKSLFTSFWFGRLKARRGLHVVPTREGGKGLGGHI